jgi:hypothetical protein
MTRHDRPSDGPRHGGPTASRAASWRPGRVLAVGLTLAVVGAGTWLLGAGADSPASRPQTAVTGSLPADSAPPLAVAPPPSGATENRSAPAAGTAGSSHKVHSVAAGVR